LELISVREPVVVKFREVEHFVLFILERTVEITMMCEKVKSSMGVFVDRMNCGEEFVEHDVILWADMMSNEILHQCNSGRMAWREGKKLATTRLGSPFGEFLSILELWAEHIANTTPYASTL
jgi:hypothetical protein